MSDALPILGISMGDPSGIGPEICARAVLRESVRFICRPIVVGDAGVIRNAVARTLSHVLMGEGRVRAGGHSGDASDSRVIRPPPQPSPGLPGEAAIQVNAISDISQAKYLPNTIDVFDLKNVDLSKLKIGEVDAMSGNAAFEAVRAVIELAKSDKLDATVTAPIHKESLHRAGHQFPGHTEIFAKFTDTRDFTMMLAVESFRVVHVSTHVSLRQACDAVTKERVLAVIKLAHEACVALDIEKPRVGVAGLNPHASDGGLFGDEERLHILPAIEAANAEGINADGPHPPDTFFPKAAGGGWDIAVAMYHDQGHIPAKLRGFEFDAGKWAWTRVDGINVSLGLPIVRVSVDHGTAFDQAYKGTASDASLRQAIEYAAKLAHKRRKGA